MRPWWQTTPPAKKGHIEIFRLRTTRLSAITFVSADPIGLVGRTSRRPPAESSACLPWRSTLRTLSSWTSSSPTSTLPTSPSLPRRAHQSPSQSACKAHRQPKCRIPVPPALEQSSPKRLASNLSRSRPRSRGLVPAASAAHAKARVTSFAIGREASEVRSRSRSYHQYGASASKRPRQPREQCTYVRCRVVATVHGSYNVASDTHTGPARTRPEHLLVLEKDQLDSRSQRADGVRPQDAQQADVYLASLRDDWMQTIVSTGDIVHLVGRFESDMRKVPILLEQQSNASASNKSRSAPHPAIEIALEEPAADSTPPPDVRAESVESDDELWDDLASMPSLSQCATQEMLASDDAPRAQIMIFASRSTAPTAQITL